MPQSFYRWLCIIFFVVATASFLAELSGHRIGAGISHADKMAHFAIFALLSALLWKGFKLRPLLAVLLLGSYGGAIELVQHYFTRRNGDWWDFLADISGIASFYLLRALWHALRPRSRR